METAIESDGLILQGYLAPPPPAAGDARARRGLVLCHGFPAEPRGAPTAAQTYPELAERLAADTGWVVLTFNFRGAGGSEGDFSLGGWLTDLRNATGHVLGLSDVNQVYLCGFSTGGALALCATAEDERVGGVAALAAPADFGSWAEDPEAFLQRARHVGVIRSKAFPAAFEEWARQLGEIRPLSAVGKIPPRPVLLVHGADDDTVPVMDARALADAASGEAELRVITGAGHRLRHDPRAIAVLIGWLERRARVA